MATRGRMATANGLALTLIAVGAGVSSTGRFALLVCFAGVLAGASLIAAGVRMADEPAPPMGRPGGVLAAGARRRNHLAFTGLLLASSASMAVAGDAGPVLCLGMLALFLLGITLINIGVRGA